MKILIDMNLSPEWVQTFTDAGIEATHWSTVGDPRATDRSIMAWALAHGYIVFTTVPIQSVGFHLYLKAATLKTDAMLI